MTWMDEGIKEIEVSDDLYIRSDVGDGYIDLHSKQLDKDMEPGVLITLEELDELIEALMQVRKELEAD